MKDLSYYNLLENNTFGIEARCKRFLEYTSVEEAQQVASIVRESSLPLLIIGGGSNLLLTRDFDGIVVHSAIMGKKLVPQGSGKALLRAGSGERWDELVAWSVSQGYGSLVNLSAIPGDVGASAVQNIGAYGAEASQFIDGVTAVEIASGRVVEIAAADCQYAYRQSRFKHEWKNNYLICSVSYRLDASEKLNMEYGNIRTELQRKGFDEPSPAQLRETIIEIRRQKLPDPAVEGNAGSFFMNPVVGKEKYRELLKAYPQMPHYQVNDAEEKIPAGWLIEQCGWKGATRGRAGVHDKQALVLVNRGGASGAEVVELCKAIQSDVQTRFGIEIFPEVNII